MKQIIINETRLILTFKRTKGATTCATSMNDRTDIHVEPTAKLLRIFRANFQQYFSYNTARDRLNWSKTDLPHFYSNNNIHPSRGSLSDLPCYFMSFFNNSISVVYMLIRTTCFLKRYIKQVFWALNYLIVFSLTFFFKFTVWRDM